MGMDNLRLVFLVAAVGGRAAVRAGVIVAHAWARGAVGGREEKIARDFWRRRDGRGRRGLPKVRRAVFSENRRARAARVAIRPPVWGIEMS